jgi:hypothetical protein
VNCPGCAPGVLLPRLITQQFIFGETVLSYLPLLLPLLSDAPLLVRTLLETCMSACSPREAIIALNEACQLLEEQAEQYDVSDMSDAEMQDPYGEEGVAIPLSMEDEVDTEELVDRFILVVKLYTRGKLAVLVQAATLKSSFRQAATGHVHTEAHCNTHDRFRGSLFRPQHPAPI